MGNRETDRLESAAGLTQKGNAKPLLVLTAYQSVELDKEAIRFDAVDYLAKPFERDQILQAVQRILGGLNPVAESGLRQREPCLERALAEGTHSQ